jgi:LacI family transcriptional regulator
MWVDTDAIGRQAAHALLDALENGATGPGHAVQPELRIRASAAAPAQTRARAARKK